MEEHELTNSDKFKHGICYVPFGGVILFFTENKKSPEFIKHIKYSTFLLVVYLLLNFILIGLFMLSAGGILFIVYAGITGFLGWKAYNGEDVQLDYIDDFEQKIKDNMNDSTPASNEKKEVKKQENKDEDILDF